MTKDELLTKLRTTVVEPGPVDDEPRDLQTGTVEPAGTSDPSSEASSLPIDQNEPTGPLSEEDRMTAIEARLAALEPPRAPGAYSDPRREERARVVKDLCRHRDDLLEARSVALLALDDDVGHFPTRALVEDLYLACRRAYSIEAELYGRSLQVLRPAWMFPIWVKSLGLTHETLSNPRMAVKPVVPFTDAVRSLLDQLDALGG